MSVSDGFSDRRRAIAGCSLLIGEGGSKIMEKRLAVALMLVLVVFLALPALGAEPVQTATAEPATPFVPVAIWELSRDGFPAVRHAWVAGSDKMLRVSWDDGATWVGFKPTFSDTSRKLLTISVRVQEEIGRGEVEWREKATLTLLGDQVGRVSLAAGSMSPAVDVTLRLIEIKEVAPCDLQPESSAAADAGSGVVPMSGGGGGKHCCVTCQGVTACDCAVCIEACQTSCCVGGCFCPPCG
jgi:hypothetical protein